MARYFHLLCFLLYFFSVLSRADDIEIFLHKSSSAVQPYLQIVLDYHPDIFLPSCHYGMLGSCAPPYMSQRAYDHLPATLAPGDLVSRLDIFIAILSGLAENPAFTAIRVSLTTSNVDDGATILSGYGGPTALAEEEGGIDALIATLKSLSASTVDAAPHPFQPRENYFEWLRYLNGGAVISGRATTGNFAAGATVSPVPDYDPSIMTVDGRRYLSPFEASESCPRLFSLLWASGVPRGDDASAPDLVSILGNNATDPVGFGKFLRQLHSPDRDLVPGGLGGVNALEKTWVISSGDGPADARAWSRAGGSDSPLNIDEPLGLERTLGLAFREMLSVSGTALPPRGPVHWFAQTAARDDLYLALFEPRSTLNWPGNLKKLQLLRSGPGAAVQIVDAAGRAAFDDSEADAGKVNFDALTLWTDATSLPMVDSNQAPPGADGGIVNRGGAGQKIPGFVRDGVHAIGDTSAGEYSRALYIEPGKVINGAENVLLPFDADGLGVTSTPARLRRELGAVSAGQARDLIRWTRGQDVDDEDADGNTSEARAWIMGQVLHSKPVALNYGAVNGYSKSNPNIRVFVGTGAGMLHAIENTHVSGQESGVEVFGFLPREMLPTLVQRREDVISSLKMPYGIDGEPVLFTRDNNGDGSLDWAPPFNDKAYVYFGLRRGGQSYYALDVSNPTAVPTLLWKITRTQGGDFDELGLTFSTPLVGTVKFGGQQIDVVIFAGGYHGGWNNTGTGRIGKDLNSADDHHNGVDTGNAIYIVDAKTGELIWKAVFGQTTSTALTSSNTRFEHAQLVDSIPSTIAALKTPSGNIHRLYVGDTGGTIWRVDLPVGNDVENPDHRRENWFISKLAELGTDGSATDRRFFHPPDLIQSRENSGTAFDGLLISSGNRADPNETEVLNYHFYLKDAQIVSGHPTLRTRAPVRISDIATASGLADITACATTERGSLFTGCEASLDRGWMIKMLRPGEKGLATPLVDGGKVYFTSYVPAKLDGCRASEGESSVYVVNLEDGQASFGASRIHMLGAGLSSGVMALGDKLLSPLGGIDAASCQGKLCDSIAEKLQLIYWRDPRIDFH